MPTVLTHPFAALALGPWFRRAGVGPTLWAVGAACAVVPDLDTIGFAMGIPYGAPWGHRGLTHSLAFALVVGLAVASWWRRLAPDSSFRAVASFLCLATASHGLLDAFTDGGLGVALLSPFARQRFFFPWRPIAVSPIGLHGFLASRSLAVLASEGRWVVLPALVVAGMGWWLLRRRSAADGGSA